MKRMLTWILMVTIVFGFLGVRGSALAEDSKLLLWVCTALVSDADQKLPQEQWLINELASEFEAENPGVEIEVNLITDPIALMQTFKAAASAGGEAPDIVNVWAGQQLFELQDIVVDITDLIPQEDKEQIIGWDIMTLNFEEGNPILGYPASGNEVCGFFYNREVLAACNLDYDTNPPATVQEFMKDMKVIKDAGYLPLAAADGGFGEAFYYVYASWWLQASGSQRVITNSQGKTKFAEDQGFLDAIQAAADMHKEGYINVDYATIPSAMELFYNGDVAFMTTTNWNTSDAIAALGEENVGFMCPPDISENVTVKNTCIGGPGQALAVSKTSENPELAVKFLSFISNKENFTRMLIRQSKLSLRKDITAADLGIGETGIFKQELDASQNYVFWADNTMVPEVNSEIQRLSPLALTNRMSVMDFAQALDKKAVEANAK